MCLPVFGHDSWSTGKTESSGKEDRKEKTTRGAQGAQTASGLLCGASSATCRQQAQAISRRDLACRAHSASASTTHGLVTVDTVCPPSGGKVLLPCHTQREERQGVTRSFQENLLFEQDFNVGHIEDKPTSCSTGRLKTATDYSLLTLLSYGLSQSPSFRS